MNEVTQLAKLQELEITLDETNILHERNGHEGIGSLQQDIDKLRNRIPPGILLRYNKLRSRGLAVAEEHKGTCSGCRLNIPQGDLNRMRNGIMDWVCPNCGRFIVLSNK
ncbi:MAG: hypothetical protein K9N51_05425 [Candidatus Pacebacteria bacterium]|nr:hypothetical protein [Candidatus Paceibacterota bacterium]